MSLSTERLVKAARELMEAVVFDDSGMGGKGGNGGLLSRETIRKADALRLALYGYDREQDLLEMKSND